MYQRLNRIGFIDPATAAGIFSAVKSVFGTISSIFGDKSPNYPIKSANTERKLREEVNQNIPFPSTVAEAQTLKQKALDLIQQNENRDNSRRVIDSIQMMYREAIAILDQYIASGGKMIGTQVVSVPINSGSGSGTGTGTGSPIYTPPTTRQADQFGFTTKDILLFGGIAAGIYFLSRKKGR